MHALTWCVVGCRFRILIPRAGCECPPGRVGLASAARLQKVRCEDLRKRPDGRSDGASSLRSVRVVGSCFKLAVAPRGRGQAPVAFDGARVSRLPTQPLGQRVASPIRWSGRRASLRWCLGGSVDPGSFETPQMSDRQRDLSPRALDQCCRLAGGRSARGCLDDPPATNLERPPAAGSAPSAACLESARPSLPAGR